MIFHKKTTVALVDTYMLFGKGLKTIIESISNLKVVGVGQSITDAIGILKQHKPNVIIIDVPLIEKDSFEELQNKLAHSANTKIILMSEKDYCGEYIVDAFNQGVHGFLLKTMPSNQLIEAIISVSQGRFWLHPNVSHYIAKAYKKLNKSQLIASSYKTCKRPSLFTNREYQVLQLLVEGDTNIEIATKLDITEFTVKTHLRNIFSKIHVRDRTNAAIVAIRNNWVDINKRENLSST